MESKTRYALERKSSAATLSDMEIFIFPDLMYALVLANIMSPRLWEWRGDPWFAAMTKLSPYRRTLRLKQFIIDHYGFNLDLETWGLTTRERELGRFAGIVDPEAVAGSNALFGYEGDRYYFDIDIRTHFGLDKYDGNVIPYWKTETVEAMDAFRHKPGYATGAGECVSLAALYAAALFVVAGISMDDIYLMATPLHSQNFIDVGEGILTNNRRLVTRNMWYNGTALSAQARRALENERVTIVTHHSGHVHTLYETATMNRAAYDRFAARLRAFLKAGFSADLLGNFLRHERDLQKCFQMRWEVRGVPRYARLERVFAYEHNSPYSLTGATRARLMSEMDFEEFEPAPIPGRIGFNALETFVKEHRIQLDREADLELLRRQFTSDCLHRDRVVEGLKRFCHVVPALPDPETRRFVEAGPDLGIAPEMSRERIVAALEERRGDRIEADLAFYAFRDLRRSEAAPFLAAAVRRNPVSALAARRALEDRAPGEWARAAFALVEGLADESIYDGPGRLAQPDEVWNFGRGDGLEKAILLANLLRETASETPMTVRVSPREAALRVGRDEYVFGSGKELPAAIWPVPGRPPSEYHVDQRRGLDPEP